MDGNTRSTTTTATSSHRRALAVVSLWLLGAGALLTGAPHAAAAGASDPYGFVDVVRQQPVSAVEVAGWAKDPDGSGPIPVHVYVDGVGAAILKADIVRPDLQAALGEAAHGFDAKLAIGVGHHTVCAYGINTFGPGGNALLECKEIDVSGSPIGSLDLVTDLPAPSLTGPTTSRVAGWALDPDVTDPVEVHVYVDGAFKTAVTAHGTRPDVGAARPGYGSDHGFSIDIAVPYGPHLVCVFALNIAGTRGDPALLGCRGMSSQAGLPFGVVDQTVGTATGLVVRGWAIDPYNYFYTSTCSLNPGMCPPRHDIIMDFLVDGNLVRQELANVMRPDVASVAPPLWTTQNAGFDYEVPVAPGDHQVCVVAEHHPSPVFGHDFDAPNATIGCFDVSR